MLIPEGRGNPAVFDEGELSQRGTFYEKLYPG